MTAICTASGPSHIKAGVTDTIVYTSSALYLLGLVPGLEWLAGLGVLGGALEYDLTTICPADPPGYPTFTEAELSSFLTFTFDSNYSSFIAKVNQAVTQVLWYQFCECVSGGTPGITTAPTPPAGITVFTGTPPTAVQPCITIANHDYFPSASNSGGFGPPIFHFNGGSITDLRIIYANTVTTPPGYSVTVHFEQFDQANNLLIDQTLGTLAPGATGHFDLPPSPVFSSTQFFWTRGAGSGANTLSISGEAYCNGDMPGAVTGPCCPPDPGVQAQLDRVLALLTLIQRQHVPFAYIAGTAHTGISGNGTIAVQGLVGIKVDLTTAPSRLGQEAGDPITLYEAGWINVGYPDGFGPRQFISSDPFVLFPISGAATLIGYSIPSDVTATITELVREP